MLRPIHIQLRPPDEGQQAGDPMSPNAGEQEPAPRRRQRTRPPTPLDLDGQPINTAFNATRRSERSTSELIGLAKGIIADGEVSRPEFGMLLSWLEANPEATFYYPGNVLLCRVHRIIEDRVVDDEELDDLGDLLKEMTGMAHGPIRGANAATTLPFDHPPPQMQWTGSVFVFTGKFAYGPRSVCEREVCGRGGQCAPSPSKRTRYLVIGTVGSRDWFHTTHGRKIEHAVNLREKGVPIAIISEDHWAMSL
jgi:hypothetical protein